MRSAPRLDISRVDFVRSLNLKRDDRLQRTIQVPDRVGSLRGALDQVLTAGRAQHEVVRLRVERPVVTRRRPRLALQELRRLHPPEGVANPELLPEEPLVIGRQLAQPAAVQAETIEEP